MLQDRPPKVPELFRFLSETVNLAYAVERARFMQMFKCKMSAGYFQFRLQDHGASPPAQAISGLRKLSTASFWTGPGDVSCRQSSELCWSR